MARTPRRRRVPFAAALCLLVATGLQTGCRAQETWPLWDAYARRIIDGQGRVIDHTAQDRTTSEGEAYGLFFALVANDRTRFDKLLNWTEQNLADGDLTQRLPAWSWGKRPDGSWGVTDQNPASDADLWMAYALSEAGRLWHTPRYQKLGTALAARIAQQEVAFIPGLGTALLPGTTGFHPDAETWLLNPSYLPPQLLAYFAKMMPTGPWAAILESLEPLLTRGSGSGYAMDWVAAGGSIRPSVTPTQVCSSDTAATPVGSYDAIRVYLWLGTADPQTPVVRQLLPRVLGMANYMKQRLTPPERVDATGRVVNPAGPPGFSAALVPYLRALNMGTQVKEQMERLSESKDTSTGLYGKDAAYYDQNLSLFGTGWVEQRYRFDPNGRLQVKWK
ncbi:cellulose synthase complex periplasmic endoglucanase BcsZ [Edaphobacter bradus]|uniref:cellulose synthase complex periplasmic endoglucanase BcsZ n=1 Tax=Edaphobacter bradus TaxID=2259016 RepID=UPI0021E08E63|nr:cellulose synthase complex periplasmic endoglucanase BcsZ [Edaphobacter bradus]